MYINKKLFQNFIIYKFKLLLLLLVRLVTWDTIRQEKERNKEGGGHMDPMRFLSFIRFSFNVEGQHSGPRYKTEPFYKTPRKAVTVLASLRPRTRVTAFRQNTRTS